jgi:hypothetical protein
LGVGDGAGQSEKEGEGELDGAFNGCGHGTSPSRGLLRKVFERETLGLDLLRGSDVKPQKVKGFCHDRFQSLQNKPFLSEDFGCIFVFLSDEEFHRFYVYFTGRVK